jgi:hypothetical protein
MLFIYSALVFVLPTNTTSQASLGLSNLQYTFLILVLRLPLIILLALIFYAYRRMHHYSVSISDTPEGRHFATITKGLGWLVWGLLVITIGTALTNAYANVDPAFRITVLIIINYAYVLLTLVVFGLVSAGAHRLIRSIHLTFTTRHIRLLMFVLVLFGVMFCYLISIRLQGNDPLNTFNAYYVPNIVVWGTIVVPYLYAWFLGLFAAIELMIMARNTPGIIYRRALQYFALGLATLVLSMVVMQYFRSVVPRTGSLSIYVTLSLVYMIYLLAALGSIMITRGAHRLQKIEDA